MKHQGKVKWHVKDGSLELFVDDGEGYKFHSSSIHFRPDSLEKGFSRGFNTLQACLEAGYDMYDVKGNPIPEESYSERIKSIRAN